MSVRTLTLVTLVVVTGTTTGCGGMKNFLFGRGARCGLCNRMGAVGSALNPLAASPGVAPAPVCGSPAPGGCFGRRLFNRGAAPSYAPPVAYAGGETCTEGCGSGYVGSGYADGGYVDGSYMSGTSGGCQSCQSHGGMHEGTVVDPYLGGPVMNEGYIDGGYPSQGYSGEVYQGESYPSGSYQGGAIQGDNFYNRNNGYQSRKFDSRGDEIINASPLPAGAQIIN